MPRELTTKEVLVSGFKNNPTFVQFLGMCPTLAITTSMGNAIGMGAGVIFVLTLSNILVSLIRKVTPDSVRIPVYIVVIASLVTILQMLMQAFTPDLSASLGTFLPLITVNCIILGRAEAFASKNTLFKSTLDGLSMGVGFTVAIMAISAVREIIGKGTFFGIAVLSDQFQMSLFVKSAGAFLVFGTLVAIVTKLKERNANKA
jgi:electron transport complex protein RnfE